MFSVDARNKKTKIVKPWNLNPVIRSRQTEIIINQRKRKHTIKIRLVRIGSIVIKVNKSERN